MRSSNYFDQDAADRAVKFINRLQHTKGRWAGVPFKLRPWQERIIRDVFGWKNADGTRQYRYLYIEIPRGNGKSELCAAIALLLLFADLEPGAEIYGAACDRDQASIVFNVAAAMVRQHPKLRRRCKIIDSTKRIIVPKTGSFYRAIPADAAGGHGFNAHGVIFDELHVQKTRDLWDALTSGQGKREQPLVVAITTAGTDRQSICWEAQLCASDPRWYSPRPDVLRGDLRCLGRGRLAELKTWKMQPSVGRLLGSGFEVRTEATSMPAQKTPSASI
jgi:phage terminase large subunit-like protein